MIDTNDDRASVNNFPIPENDVPAPASDIHDGTRNFVNETSVHDNPSLTEHKNKKKIKNLNCLAAAYKTQVERAERIVKSKKVFLKHCEIDDNVVVPTSMADRG